MEADGKSKESKKLSSKSSVTYNISDVDGKEDLTTGSLTYIVSSPFAAHRKHFTTITFTSIATM